MLPPHLFLTAFRKIPQNWSSPGFGVVGLFFPPENTHTNNKKQIGFILNKKVFPSQRLSSELFGNIPVLKENDRH